MDRPPPSPEWVIAESEPSEPEHEEYRECARKLWPRILSYARRQDRGLISLDDKEPLATEIWERVLLSVFGTRARLRAGGAQIANLEAYLIGAFRHRFNRALKREKQRRHVVEAMPPEILASLPDAQASQWKETFEQDLQVRQIVTQMDDWTREVWGSLQFGYSWREIAAKHGMNEPQAKMKFRYAIKKIQKKLAGSQQG